MRDVMTPRVPLAGVVASYDGRGVAPRQDPLAAPRPTCIIPPLTIATSLNGHSVSPLIFLITMEHAPVSDINLSRAQLTLRSNEKETQECVDHEPNDQSTPRHLSCPKCRHYRLITTIGAHPTQRPIRFDSQLLQSTTMVDYELDCGRADAAEGVQRSCQRARYQVQPKRPISPLLPGRLWLSPSRQE
jgi:hypothetical protein